MPTVVTTPKSTTANSYASEADGDTYFGERTNSTDWTSATTATKEQAVISGSRLLDICFEWQGSIMESDQAMRWPRSGVTDEDGRYVDPDTIPVQVTRAALETALFLIKSDRVAEPGLLGQGFSEASVGDLEVTVDRSEILPYIPKHVVAMLAAFGTLKPEASRDGSRMVKLRRS